MELWGDGFGGFIGILASKVKFFFCLTISLFTYVHYAASRGPLGSLMIIFHHRAQSFVSLGALVLVFLIAFDPFIQQVLKYPVWLAPNSNEMAIAPQLREFMPGNSTMDKALSQGFWSDQDFTPLLCPSGNCTTFPNKDLASFAQRGKDMDLFIEQKSYSISGNRCDHFYSFIVPEP